MQIALAIVAFLLGVSLEARAQSHASLSPWHVDVATTVFREAWDRNDSTEWLSGAILGVDRRIWRGLAVRTEALALRVFQHAEDAWLRGLTLGTRARWRRGSTSPVIDVAVGISDATQAVPPRGTSFNYLAAIGGGIEVPLRRMRLAVTGRWLHASNNGREGRHRNPDIQSLGLIVGVGWE
jgi:hypothetical protein